MGSRKYIIQSYSPDLGWVSDWCGTDNQPATYPNKRQAKADIEDYVRSCNETQEKHRVWRIDNAKE